MRNQCLDKWLGGIAVARPCSPENASMLSTRFRKNMPVTSNSRNLSIGSRHSRSELLE
jgi:hypothetical protein